MLGLKSIGTLLALTLVAPGAAGFQGVNGFDILDPPSPLPPGSAFGHSVVILDYDGDGVPDLAVGAPGLSTVYLFRGSVTPQNRYRLDFHRAFQPDGPLAVGYYPASPASDAIDFGASLAAGPYDAQAGDELFVGAPGFKDDRGAFYVFGQGLTPNPGSPPVHRQAPQNEPIGRMGASIAVGYFDQDQRLDVAVGAPNAQFACPVADKARGRVYLFTHNLGTLTWLDNPHACLDMGAWNGFFGGHVHAAPRLGGGHELFAGAEGNPGGQPGCQPGCHPNGGEVARYDWLQVPSLVQYIHDPQAANNARYAKWSQARDGWLVVGAPRKHTTVKLSGAMFLYELDPISGDYVFQRRFVHPGPQQSDLIGARVGLGNLVGDGTNDLVAVAWDGVGTVHIWNGADVGDPNSVPTSIPGPAGNGTHFGEGFQVGRLYVPLASYPYEQAVLGAPNFDGQRGRVLILR